MNQRGEMNLFFVLMVVALSGVMILSALRLHHSYRLMEKRTELFLCMKETEGEMVRYMKFMGRTNWALKHLFTLKVVAAFIPGLQGVALDSEKAKRLIIHVQTLSLFAYMKKLSELKARGCPLDPRMVTTPFKLSGKGYVRDMNDVATLRNKKWTYYYASLPYVVNVDWDVTGFESIWPKITRASSENAVRSSLISSFY